MLERTNSRENISLKTFKFSKDPKMLSISMVCNKSIMKDLDYVPTYVTKYIYIYLYIWEDNPIIGRTHLKSETLFINSYCVVCSAFQLKIRT